VKLLVGLTGYDVTILPHAGPTLDFGHRVDYINSIKWKEKECSSRIFLESKFPNAKPDYLSGLAFLNISSVALNPSIGRIGSSCESISMYREKA
jgi:hypothetical protein